MESLSINIHDTRQRTYQYRRDMATGQQSLLVGLPAPSPEPLPTLLRAKIEDKVTRPQVTLRLSWGGPYRSFAVTAASRAKIRGAPAEVFSIKCLLSKRVVILRQKSKKSSNVALKPAEGGAGALSNKRGPVVLCS